MFNPAAVLAAAFAEHLVDGYRTVYGNREPDHSPIIRSMAQLAVERISSSDALYHDAQHTMLVTLVGQAILRGRIIVEVVTPEDWLHFTVATLCHDLGYLRGICPGDEEGRYVIDEHGHTIEAPRGVSDAFLAPWHIDRGKLFVRHRCRAIPVLDVERIARAIELTRFPIPCDRDHAETGTEPALVRAADLIGQLGDPDHPRKLNALYYEFCETGMNEKLGYRSPADLAEQYPRFFWSKVEPYLGTAIRHLERTVEGKQWIAQLYAHVFVEEHRRSRPGPERAPRAKAAEPPATVAALHPETRRGGRAKRRA
ncbi:metal-dependent phosphohydrolase [Benzoatithermus flavus]|uniref:Metal-dependent phosphohydrolase n=1 Tax=Benzoatithermus flavus TaxID=3108223 RepID=A0ABU8XRL6_9PROT